MTLKPLFSAFMYRGIRSVLLSAVVVLLISLALLPFFPFFSIPLVFFIFVWAVFALISRYIAYTKEEYEFLDKHIIHRGGGLFHSFQTTVQYENITYLSRTYPFIETKLFSTHAVFIQTAGSRNAEIVLEAVTEGPYEQIIRAMKKHGFSLSLRKSVLQSKPSALGIFIDIFSGLITTVIGLVFFFGGFVPILSNYSEFLFQNILLMIGLIFLLALIGLGLLLSFIFKFLDYKMREYQIYSDAVRYYEGFLTRHEAIIPMENIADAQVTKSILDRMFSLAKITISCKGQGQEITFAHMPNAKEIESVIDASVTKVVSQNIPKKQQTKSSSTKKVVSAKHSTQSGFSMHKGRAILPLIPVFFIGLLFPPLLFGLIPVAYQKISRAFGAKFYVTKRGVREYFSFINKNDREFTDAKITGVVVTKGIIDRFFGTHTITFWSIGSDKPMLFEHVRESAEIDTLVLTSFGSEKIQQTIPASWSIIESFFRFIVIHSFLMLAVCVSLLIGVFSPFFLLGAGIGLLVILLFFTADFLRHQVAKTHYYKTYSSYHVGTIRKTSYYVKYQNVKSLTYTKHPFRKNGTIVVDVAGESAQGKTILPNMLSMGHIIDCETHMNEFNKRLGYKPSKELFRTQPQARNGVWIFIVPLLWPFLPFYLWSYAVKTYIVEENQIRYKSGILYKQEKTILLHKIDHVSKAQGFLHNIFGNGAVLIYTTGSGSVDMVVSPILPFAEVHQYLESVSKDS